YSEINRTRGLGARSRNHCRALDPATQSEAQKRAPAALPGQWPVALLLRQEHLRSLRLTWTWSRFLFLLDSLPERAGLREPGHLPRARGLRDCKAAFGATTRPDR